MKQKAKSKLNPFIQDLHADEEILWFYASSSAWAGVEMLKRAARLATVFLFSISLAGIAFFLLQALVIPDILLLTMSILLLGVIAVLGFVMMYPFSLLRAAPSHVYAVTNTRLLSHIRGKVISLALEEINTLYISSPEEGHLFLSLSAPEWRNIPHPEEVLEIITQAREKRIHRLDMEQDEGDDEGKNEGQSQSIHDLTPTPLHKRGAFR